MAKQLESIKMKKLILIHTSTTEYDDQGRIQGNLDVPLSEAGRQQASAMAAELAEFAPTCLYHSPGQASGEMAEILADALDLKPRTLEKLSNINHGLWQGMLVEDVKLKQPKVFRKWQEHPETVCPPEGETIPAACDRVSEVLHKLIRKSKSESTTLLVAPDPLASIIRYVITGAELRDFWERSESAGRWELIEVDKPAELNV